MAMLIFMQFHHGEWSAENLFIFPENVTHPRKIRNGKEYDAKKSRNCYTFLVDCRFAVTLKFTHHTRHVGYSRMKLIHILGYI